MWASSACCAKCLRGLGTVLSAPWPEQMGEAHAFGEVLRAFHAILNHAQHREGVGPAPVPYDSPAGLRLLEERLARHGAASPD